MKDLRDYNLKIHNTFGMDVTCRRFLEYESAEEARTIARTLSDTDRPLLIIGGGSNLLLTGDFRGTVVHSAVKGMTAMEEGDTVLLACGSGETWDDVVALSVANGWRGAENLSLIPGEVGASAVQNIGAYGAEVCQIIHRIEAVELATGEWRVFTADECAYGYRDSRFKHEWKDRYLITSVTYRLSKSQPLRLDYGNIRAELERQGIADPTPTQLRQAIIDIRNAKLPDPKVEGNGGSFFMNPVVTREKFEQLLADYPSMPHYRIDDEHEKIPAGWMIEQCGWKGRSLGRAGVHGKQALVLVNRGGATGDEVVALMRAIQHDVEQKFGISIRPEVNII